MPPEYNSIKGVWASEIEDRSPKFKVHNSEALAYAAVHYKLYSYPRGGDVYRLGSDNTWVLEHSCRPDLTCSICGLEIEHRGDTSVLDYNPGDPHLYQIVHWKCKKTYLANV